MPETLAVRCRGITKRYGEGDAAVIALRGVDLDIRRAELLMLVGPSGCGKTTLISIVTAILVQDAGECLVLGRDVARLDEAARARFRRDAIGFVFQAFNLLPALTALENVCVPLLLRGMGRTTAQPRARALLDAVGLAGRMHSLPSRLSGGQQQRVAIARALVHQPELVVCDEPTSNLDQQAGHDMMNLLQQLVRAEGRTLVVVTHDQRILGFADRVARMEDGTITNIAETAASPAS